MKFGVVTFPGSNGDYDAYQAACRALRPPRTWRSPPTRRSESMCGIFGVRNQPEAVSLTKLGLYSLQHRGQESAGVVAVEANGNARGVRSMKTLDGAGRMKAGIAKMRTAASHTARTAIPNKAGTKTLN